MPTQRLVAIGTHLGHHGTQVFSIAHGPGGQVVLTNITGGFAFSPAAHTHYLLGAPALIGATLPPGAPPGSLWVITSTNPPAAGVWPNGHRLITLSTTDVQQSGHQTGTMQQSAAGNSVYMAKDLVFYIPNAAWAGPVFAGGVMVPALPAPTPVTWDIDI